MTDAELARAVDSAYDPAMAAFEANDGFNMTNLRAALEAAAPLIAAAAEAKAREECAEETKALKADIRRLKPYKAELRKIAKSLGEPNDPFAAWEALEAIRTGAAS